MVATRIAAVTIACAVALAPPAAAAPDGGAVGFVLPVDGPVARPFDPPLLPFGPGHRGVDLAVPGGTVVVASGDGTVRFAGPVAGANWVTLVHADGVVTAYGPLASVQVRVGDRVAAGHPVGRSAGPSHPGGPPTLHWSARRGPDYVDPLGLLARERPALTGPGGWHLTEVPGGSRYDDWDGRHRFGLVPRSRPADGPGWASAPNPNHAVGVAGLGSRTGSLPLDLTDLGYGPGDVSYLSYSPNAGSYGPEDTWRGVDAAARRLTEHLRERWAASPGQAVDLVGHSMGGVVILHYLMNYHDPTDPTLPPIANVATIASPLGGADVAAAIVEALGHPAGRAALRGLGAVIGQDPASRAVADLAVGSPLLRRLRESWAQANRDVYAGPLATGTHVATFGGDLDVVVPEHRSDLDGAPHVVLPGTHHGVRETEASRIALHEFLSGAPIPGEPGGLAHWLSYPLGWGEQLLVGLLVPP